MAGLIRTPALIHPGSLEAILRRIGVWNRCVFALDAGDPRCTPNGPLGQYMFDLSPLQWKLTRGLTSAASTDDPTLFPGGIRPTDALTDIRVPHWQFDGGDGLVSDTKAGPWETWSADAGKFSMLAVCRITAGGLAGSAISRQATSTSDQATLGYTASETWRIHTNSASIISGASAVTGQWMIISASLWEDGGSGVSWIRVNNTVTTGNPSSSSPGTGGRRFTVGCDIDDVNALDSFFGATGYIMAVAAFDAFFPQSFGERVRQEFRAWRVPQVA